MKRSYLPIAGPPAEGMCVHCICRVATRPRGLCQPCYITDAIRMRYPKVDKVGEVWQNGKIEPAAEPTNELPGTEAKLQVMRQRIELGQHLHHPDDAKPNLLRNGIPANTSLAKENAERRRAAKKEEQDDYDETPETEVSMRLW